MKGKQFGGNRCITESFPQSTEGTGLITCEIGSRDTFDLFPDNYSADYSYKIPVNTNNPVILKFRHFHADTRLIQAVWASSDKEGSVFSKGSNVNLHLNDNSVIKLLFVSQVTN